MLTLLTVSCLAATARAYPLTVDDDKVNDALAYLASCRQADGGGSRLSIHDVHVPVKM